MILFSDILFVFFIISVCLQVLFALFLFRKLLSYNHKDSKFSKGVSVIICAQDESENLSNNLPSFLAQDYPIFEVIVVNDQSVDGTKYLLQDLEKKNQNLLV